jgi:prevent-host-death family protein
MEVLTANKAKTHFGELLMKVQKAPVQIDKNGKPVAVVVSIEDYEATEKIKFQLLQQRAKQAKIDIANGDVVEGNKFIENLLADVVISAKN